jgi:hypothetical protein
MMPQPNTDACVRRPGPLIDLIARVFERTKEFASMSKGPHPFKESDIARACNAVKKAGLVVSSVEIDKSGKIIVVTQAQSSSSDPDPELVEFEKRNGAKVSA